MGKVYKFLSVALCAVLAVFLTACQSVFAGGEDTLSNEYNKYGYVSGYGSFLCSQVDDTTSHIYLDPVFVNTGTVHIKKATITVEFVDIGKYPTSAYYEPVATYTVTVENIGVGQEKRFRILADISVDSAEYRLDILESGQVLNAYFHKIEWEITTARPSADAMMDDRNFL